jgi:FkbM family methyltransferase
MIKFLRKIKHLLKGIYIPVKIKRIEKRWYGNNYGGFYLYDKNLDNTSVIYSIGIGEDVSFDMELINKFKCKVFAYDPTPKSVKWVDKIVNKDNFIFHPLGVANQKGEREFYLPKNQNHVSGSINNINSVEIKNSIKLNFDSLNNLMKLKNHNKIDVLKMDIEGAEYEVIDHIKKYQLDIKQILVEFHPHFENNGRKKTLNAIESLEAMGYHCYGRSDSLLEYSFIK